MYVDQVQLFLMGNKRNKSRKTVKAVLKVRRAHSKRMHMHNRWKRALLRNSKSAIAMEMESSEVTAGSGRLTLDVFMVLM